MEEITTSPNGDFSKTCMVMLVDDQPMVAEALRRILMQEEDMDLHYCQDPEQALRMAEQIKPSVILLDLVMPDIDGLMVLRYMRSNPLTRDVPMIVLSSQEDPELKAEAFAVGANDYLIKWPDRVELLARLRYHSQWYVTMQQRDEAFRALRVSQRKLAESNLRLQRLVSVDGLTGIPNRRFFDERLEEEWQRGSREQGWLTLVMIDVDHFKAYNDLHGHLAGDESLKEVAGALSAVLLRPSDVVARYGGEEFVLILPGTDPDGAIAIAEKMLKAIDTLGIPHETSPTSRYLTISLGVATTVPSQNVKSSILLAEADSALYEAKEAGRNRYVLAPVMRV